VSLTRFLAAWRTTPLHDREVVDALVDPAHAGPSADLAAALRQWAGTYYWSDEADGRHVILTRPTQKARESWAIHALLFAAVLLTTTLTGAVVSNALPAHPGTWTAPAMLRAFPSGLWFSLPLLAILLCHELGHYCTARRYQLNVSPPFFIPGLLPPFGIGTFGAFIRLRTIVNDRRQLLDVGAAGPIAGFVIALPLLWIGLSHSTVVSDAPLQGMIVQWGGSGGGDVQAVLPLGDSAVTWLVRHFAAGDANTIVLHPAAFAGWFGMFVTMLNLLPMAQLDGGHIMYAATPRWHQQTARLFWVVLMLLGWFWIGWLLWGFIVLVLSRGQLRHPPVLDAYRPLPPSRRWVLWASLVLFLLTFAPAPFRS
jgi:membrane-associated protease RseP (regulator of RpoE activity)